MANVDDDDIDEIKTLVGCSSSDAKHYLKIFGGDVELAAEKVLNHSLDDEWWAHPWNAPSVKKENKMSLEAANDEGRSRRASSSCIDLCSSSTSGSNKNDGVSIGSMNTEDFEEIERDGRFYDKHETLVNVFVNAVCDEGTTVSDLRVLISEADAIAARDTEQSSGVSDLVNRLCFQHNADEGRTPLSYAVAKNMKQKVHDLIDLGARVSKRMLGPKTALSIAATNQKRDGTEMVRILLSKGANPAEVIEAGVNEKMLGPAMCYWIDKARRMGVPTKDELVHLRSTPPMDKIHELDYAVVGEEAAVSAIQEALAGRFGNPQGASKPLVMLLLGPPGHGKTYLSSNAARSLVGEENFLFIPCESIRDDADLFGSSLGGTCDGKYSSDGQLTKWLRFRQKKKSIVFLDEFEKVKELRSALGWGQAKKIYQSFLEPWNDGTLSDRSNGGKGQKIDCSQTIWILTANWGQQEIIDFCTKHGRMQKHIDHKDVAWIQKHLVSKILRPLCIKEFGSVHEDIKALCRRIDAIVPFLLFTKSERKVVADTAVIERFSLYRDPCVLQGPEEKRRSFGNLHLHSTRSFSTYAANLYDPMVGASGMLSAVQQADGKFQMMSVRGQLRLSKEQKARMRSPSPVVGDGANENEPNFWVHYDSDREEITITQARPIDNDNCSETSDDEESSRRGNRARLPTSATVGDRRHIARKGASDDAF